MKKFNQKILAILLMIVIACTSCRSVTVKKSATPDNATANPFETEDSTDLSSKEALEEQEEFTKFTDDMFYKVVSESSLSVHSFFSYPENYNLDNCPYSLGDVSEARFDKDNEELAEYLKQLEKFNYDLLTKEQKLTYDILKTDLEDNADTEDFYLYEDYLSPLNGVPISLPSLFGEFELNDEQDVIDYLELIKLIPDYYDDIMDYESKKADSGMGIPDFQIDALVDLCNEFISNKDNHFLITTFNDRIKTVSKLSDSDKKSYMDTNSKLIKESILPEYEKLISQLSTLKGKAKSEGGLSNFDNGKDYYEQVVRAYTGSEMSVDEIKSLIEDRMQSDLTTMISLSYKDSTLYDNMDKYPIDTSDPDKILNYLIEKINDDFPEGFESNYTVLDVPKDIEKYESPAYYYIPHIDNITKNNIYINKSEDYTDMDLYPVLAHEGFPGHMYQSTYFQNTNPDNIRRLLRYNGYIEGWGLYAELYSYELSGQSSELVKFNNAANCLSYDAYCLADIGINYEGWSRQDTIDFITKSGFDASVGDEMFETLVENPGVYLAYYVGYLEFIQMREEAQTTLGSSFNIKSFHKFILDIGPAQFEIIKDRFDIWLDNQKNAA